MSRKKAPRHRTSKIPDLPAPPRLEDIPLLDKEARGVRIRLDAFRTGRFYKVLCEALNRGFGPLLLTQEQYRSAEAAFVRVMLSDHGMFSSHRPIVSVQGKELHTVLVGPGDERPLSVSKKAVPPESLFHVADWRDPLHWRVDRLRMNERRAWTTDDPEVYAEAVQRCKKLRAELLTEVRQLRTPRRGRAFSRTPDYLQFYAKQLFFWLLLHKDFQAMPRDIRRRHEIVKRLQRHYPYLTFPPNFEDDVWQSPQENARRDTAEAFKPKVKMDSLPILFSRSRPR